ncbi:cache domain-containing protein [Pseudoalteromonas sp. KG3]|nr:MULTISPECIES: cache domain-containing protein [Pseudoalteromonas]WKD25403.1 cache domain-containing protein [Pseudoalteromonas sp. KG3]
MNISRKLKLSFALAIVLPLLIIASLVITQTRNQALDNFEMLSDREASQVDNAMQMFFSEIEKNVDFLASHPDVVSAQKDVKTYVSSNSATQLMHTQGTSTEANAYQLFNHFGETHSGLAYIYMGNEQGGYIQWPEGEVNAKYDPRQRPWYTAAKQANGNAIRTNAYYWEIDDTVIVSTVKAIKNNGQIVGVQGMDVSLQGLTDIIANIKLGETGYLMLAEDSGNILVDPKHDNYRFKQLGEVANGTYKVLANNRDGQFELNLNDTVYLVNIFSSNKLGWKYIALVEKSEVMGPVNTMT